MKNCMKSEGGKVLEDAKMKKGGRVKKASGAEITQVREIPDWADKMKKGGRLKRADGGGIGVPDDNLKDVMAYAGTLPGSQNRCEHKSGGKIKFPKEMLRQRYKEGEIK